MQDPSAYTIGWNCALEFEYAAARALLDELHEPPTDLPQNDTNTYALGRIGEHNVVTATRQWSAHSLSTAVPDMLRTFCNIRALLSVGVGGGAPSAQHDVRLGDIVVSSLRNGENGVPLYDFGKTMESRPVLETGLLYPSLNLFQAAILRLEATYERDGCGPQAKINEFLLRRPQLQEDFSRPLDGGDRLYKSDYTHRSHGECDQLCGDDPSTLVIRPPRNEGQDCQATHYGRMASSNQIIKDAEIQEKMAAEFKMLFFDNEAEDLGTQPLCLIIRGICDYADSHDSKKWQRCVDTRGSESRGPACH